MQPSSLALMAGGGVLIGAQERAILMQPVEATFTVTTSADWILEQVGD